MNIYKSGIGDNLMNPAFFTKAILYFLDAEKELLTVLSSSYDSVIEIGCTNGRYAETLTRLGKHYIGIDIADHHILEAASLHKDNAKASFLCDDAHNLESILDSTGIIGKNALLFFPFNSFGNLDNGDDILQMLRQMAMPFAIFTYATDQATAEERTRYYTASGFRGLVLLEEGSGVRFTDQSGLNTIAYSEDWFRNAFSSLGMSFQCLPFGDIGHCYTNF